MSLRILFATLLFSAHALLNAQAKLPTSDNSALPPISREKARQVPVSSLAGEGLLLAESGRSNYVVVLCANATPAEKFAAETMSTYLKRITGGDFPIVDESTTATKTILIGQTRFGEQAGIAGLGEEEWAQRTVGERLLIAGGTPRATAYGVFDFLERYAGVCQLAVDTEIVPSHPTLRVPSLDKRAKPAFLSRSVYDPVTIPKQNPLFFIWNMDNRRVLDVAPFKEFRDRQIPPHVHTFGKYFITSKDFAKTHPEYFSMDDKGLRMTDDKGTPGLWVQLCATNPDVRRITLERALRFIADERVAAAKSGLAPAKIIEISQNDNTAHLCMCGPCKAVTEREGSESGLLLDFINEIARGIAKEYPDMLVQTYAYNFTLLPPRHIRPEPNVLIKWCDNYGRSEFSRALTDSENAHMRKGLEDWSAITRQLAVWDYGKRNVLHVPGFYAPQINIFTIQPDLAFMNDQHVVAYTSETEGYAPSEHPYGDDFHSFHTLQAWLYYKIMQDPNRPLEPLLDTYFAGYYGAAAKPMRELLHYMERRQSETKGQIQNVPRHGLANLWLDAPYFSEAGRLLDAAEKAAANDPRSLEHVKYERIPVDSAFLWLEGIVRRKAGDAGKPHFSGYERQSVLNRFHKNWQSWLDRNLQPDLAEKGRSLMGKSQSLIASMSPRQLDPIALAHHVIAPGWKPDGKADEPFWSQAATLYLLPVEIDATPRNSPPVRVAWTDDFLLLSCGRANEPTADGEPAPPSQIRFFFGLPSTDSVENTLTDGTRIKGAAPIYVVSVNSNGNTGDWTDNVSANAPKWKSNAITAVRSDTNGWQAEVAIPWSSLTPPKSGKPIAFNITSSLTSSDPKAEVWSPWLRGKNAPSFWSSFFGALQLQSGPAKE
jgi:hypothetical protein